MALNPEVVGQTTDTLELTYRWQDQVLYALGIGAKREQLEFLYEGHGPRVFPTYAVIPAFEANKALFDVVGGQLAGVVHGSQEIRLHAPFPPSGTLKTIGKVDGVYDLKRMAQVVVTTETRDEGGTLLCETHWVLMYLFDGGFGGSPPPRSARIRVPEREPDWRVEETTTTEQALLYRLSGDHNPLHADPVAAKTAEKVTGGVPILHGLCTYGYIGRALLAQECGDDPNRLKVLSGRFSKPVWPGETLVTEGWREDGRVLLRAETKERPGEHVFTNAFAEVSAE